MPGNLVRNTEDYGLRARRDRSIQSGRVLVVNRTTNTAILDVGMVDNDGNPVYMIDVPFSPQTPPQFNDVVAIQRTSSSQYSMVIGAGAQVGGGNSGQVVAVGGAVTSLRVGSGTPQQGDIALYAGLYTHINQSGDTFTWSVSGLLGVPRGGATNQVLSKISSVDGDAAWETVSGATANQIVGNISAVFDGGGNALAAGSKVRARSNFAGTITKGTVFLDQTDTVSIEVRKCTYSQYDGGATHPVAGDKISAAAPLSVSAAVKSQDASLTGWTKTVAVDDIFEFYLSGVINAQTANVQLDVTKS